MSSVETCHTRAAAPVAIVTGAAGGIGRTVVAGLADDGCFVVALDRTAEPQPGAGAAHAIDLADAAAIATLFQRLADEHGPAAILVNGAGVYEARPFLDYGPGDLEHVMAINFSAAFHCTQHVVRQALAAGTRASIVNVASISGQAGSPDAGYGASKGALIALTISLGRSLAGRDIRVNAVAPGIVDTPMASRIPADRLAAYRAEIPAGRLGQPSDVAAAVRFLAGPAADYITAATLDVNGGLR